MKSKRIKQTVFFILAGFFFASFTAAQNPLETWQQYKTPEEAGFSSAKLAEAKKFYDTLGAAAYMVVYNGKVLISWGDVKRRYWLHSARKSLLSALYGIHTAEGTIDLNKTLEELKITDKTPLNKEEQQAKVIHLLKARSGVYIPAAAETLAMKSRRPKRGSHKPDTFWYYNNWDFNVLGTILEKETGTDIFVDFKRKLAEPLQMEDYDVFHGMHFVEAEYSEHAAYHFRMSARDMARFALLYLRGGKWNGKQIIPEKWIKESVIAHSSTGYPGFNAGYGYLWWIADFDNPPGVYSALGVGTQAIHVIPGEDMVIVQRVDTHQRRRKNVAPSKELLDMILAAKTGKPKPNPQLIPLQNTPSSTHPEIIKMKRETLDKYIKEYPFGKGKMKITRTGNDLMAIFPNTVIYKILPISRDTFVLEDAEQYLLFKFDDKGNPVGVTRHPTLEDAKDKGTTQKE